MGGGGLGAGCSLRASLAWKNKGLLSFIMASIPGCSAGPPATTLANGEDLATSPVLPVFLTNGVGVPFCAPLAVGVAYPATCGLIGGDFALILPGVICVPEGGVDTVLPPLIVLLTVDRGVVVSPTTDRVGVASFVGDGLRVPDVGVRMNGLFGDGGRLAVVLFAASFGVRGDAVFRVGGTVGLTALF